MKPAILTLLILLATAVAAQPAVVSTAPATNANGAGASAPVAATFSSAMSGAGPSTFRVTGNLAGPRAGNYAGAGTATLSMAPALSFMPGEKVSVLLRDLQNTGGQAMAAPFQYSYRTAAGTGPATFAGVTQALTVADNGYDTALGDLDGDGDLDIVVARYGDDYVFFNDGTGGFGAGQAFGGDNSWAVALADVDGDGDLDCAIGNGETNVSAGNQNYVYFNDGNGNLANGAPFGGQDEYSYSVVFADMDGDGDPDIVVGNGMPGGNLQNYIYFNDGGGNFGTRLAFGSTMDDTLEVGVGDLDGDGDLDIACANGTINPVPDTVYINNGGNFGAPRHLYDGIYISTLQSWGLDLGDVDLDGDLDIAVAHWGMYGGQSRVFFNDGAGNFNVGYSDFGGPGDVSSGVRLADFDGDGDLDAAHTTTGGAGTYVQLNDGSGSFPVQRIVGAGNTSAWSLAAGDLDGDGDLDLVEGNYGGAPYGYTNVYLNGGTQAVPPTITGVQPGSGPTAGGTSVILSGSAFSGATGVTFNGAAAAFTVVSNTRIDCVTPAGSAGQASVVVTTPAGSNAANSLFTYIAPTPVPSIVSINPPSGPEAGGTTVSITGSGFTAATAVTFGSAAATFNVVSDSRIDCTTPPGSGTVGVTVTGPGGSSASGATFSYTQPGNGGTTGGKGSESGGGGCTAASSHTGAAALILALLSSGCALGARRRRV